MPTPPDSSPTDKNFFLKHQVADVLEADAVLVQRSSILRRDAVKHLRRIESPRHVARPSLAIKQPLQKNRENLVRVHDVAMFIHCADTVGVAIGNEARIALLRNHRELRCLDVRKDRFGIDARKMRG